jgi:hypothetical protein
MAKPNMERVFVTGPVKSGKTCLLGALIVAAGKSYCSRDPFSCYFCDQDRTAPASPQQASSDGLGIESGSLNDLHRMASGVVLDGARIDATRTLREYRFRVEVNRRTQPAKMWRLFGWLAKTRWTADVTVLDAPGGFAWGTDDPARQRNLHRDLMFERARQSQGMILCVDANNIEASQDFFLQMPEFVGQLSTHAMPFRRIAIVLSCADQVHKDEGADNRRRLEADSPWRRLRMLLSGSLNGLLQAVDRSGAQLACGWASAYGLLFSCPTK